MSRLLKGQAARSVGSLRLPGVDAPRSSLVTGPVPVPPPVPPLAAAAVPAPAVRPDTTAADALAQARAEIEVLRERARADGLEQGRRDAARELDMRLDEQGAAWRTAITSLQEAVQGKLEELERFAVAIAFEACARVLGDAATNGLGVPAVVRQLLAQARDTTALRVQVPPADVDAVRQALRQDPHWQHRAIEIEAEPTLKAGECCLVSAHGQLETSLEVQLDAIRAALLDGHREVERDRSRRT